MGILFTNSFVFSKDPCYVAFHDEEWGVPVYDDKYVPVIIALIFVYTFFVHLFVSNAILNFIQKNYCTLCLLKLSQKTV